MRYLLILAMSLALFACKDKSEMVAAATTEAAPAEKQKEAVVKPVIVDPEYKGRETDAFSIKAASLTGDILTITVSYGGGCEEHVFELYSDKKYMKSLPPQLNLVLEHDANKDACRAMITQDLKFDLKGLQSSMGRQIRLNLANHRTPLLYGY